MKNYEIISDLEQLEKLAGKWTSKRFAFDTEFTSLKHTEQEIIGMSIFDRDQLDIPPIYIQFNFRDTYTVKEKDPNGGRKKVDVVYEYAKEDAIWFEQAKPILLNLFEGAECICANAKVEWKIFSKYGITNWTILDDVNLMAWMLNVDAPKGLKENARAVLGITMESYEKTIKQKIGNINWNLVDWHAYGVYGAKDAWATFGLWEVRLKQIKELPALYKCYKGLEIPLTYVVADMEMSGVEIDKPTLEAMSVLAEKEIGTAEQRIFDMVGAEFNIGSSKQLAEILFDRLGYPVKKRSQKTGARSVDEPTLKELSFEGYDVADDILEYRQLKKLKGTYIDAIPLMVECDGRLRGSFNASGTVTGRFSSSSPNLQNQPNNEAFPIKASFVPKKGYKFIAYDYSTIEVRVMAHESNDPKMIEIFTQGRDIHEETKQNINDLVGMNLDRGQGKCVHPDTLILTEDGYVDIGTLGNREENDTFSASNKKEVLSPDNNMIPITQFYNNGVADGKSIITKRGVVRCSDNHKLMLESGKLIKAKDLKKGDILKHSKQPQYLNAKEQYVKFNPFNKGVGDCVSLKITSEWAYFFGAFEGDGSFLTNGKTVAMACGRGEKYDEWSKILIKSCDYLGLIDKDITEVKSNNSFYLGSSNLSHFLEKAGLVEIGSGKTGRVPKSILNGNRPLKIAYLSGLIDTDGYVSKDSTVSITSKKLSIIQDLSVLLSSIGYDYGIQESYNKKYLKYYYTIHIYSDSLLQFFSEHKLKCPWKIDRLKERVKKIRNRKSKGIGKTPNKPNEIRLIVDEVMPLVDIEVGTDEHLYVANTFVGHNTINFGVLYLMGADSLAYMLNKQLRKEYRLGKLSKQEYINAEVSKGTAQQIIDGYFGAYKGFGAFVKQETNYVRKSGWSWTLGGRRRPVPELKSNRTFGIGQRKAVNSPIQGGAADIMKLAMVKLFKRFNELGYDAKILLSVHDELVIEAKDDYNLPVVEALVKETMETVFPACKVPLIAEGGIYDNWAGLKSHTLSKRGNSGRVTAMKLLNLKLI